MARSCGFADAGERVRTDGYEGLSDTEVLITGWGTPPVTDDVLQLPRLRVIMHVAGSVREVIEADVWARDIRVVTAAEANNDRVADYVAAMTLLALKGSFRARAAMLRTGRLPGAMAGPGAVGQTLGLVSFGSIARKVADRAAAWDMNVIPGIRTSIRRSSRGAAFSESIPCRAPRCTRVTTCCSRVTPPVRSAPRTTRWGNSSWKNSPRSSTAGRSRTPSRGSRLVIEHDNPLSTDTRGPRLAQRHAREFLIHVTVIRSSTR